MAEKDFGMLVKPAQGDVFLSWMSRQYVREVMNIEKSSCELFWEEQDLVKCLRTRNCIGLVATRCEQVMGYMVYELHKTEVSLLNLVVHPKFRRQGIGTLFLNKLKAKLTPERRQRVSYEVRESNLDGHLFLKANGFRATGIQKNFFIDEYAEQTKKEDAYSFNYDVLNDIIG